MCVGVLCCVCAVWCGTLKTFVCPSRTPCARGAGTFLMDTLRYHLVRAFCCPLIAPPSESQKQPCKPTVHQFRLLPIKRGLADKGIHHTISWSTSDERYLSTCLCHTPKRGRLLNSLAITTVRVGILFGSLLSVLSWRF